MNKRLILLFLILLGLLQAQAKTKRFGTWIEAEIAKDIFKKFEFTLEPEIRLQDNFSVDEYMINGKLTFKPAKFIRLSGAYRFITDVKNKGNERFHRFGFDVTGRKKWKRLEASIRARLTNYADFDSNNNKNNYLRYRLKFEYDIPNCKFRPFTSYELFHLLSGGEINKSRFDIGGSYKIFSKNRVGAYYRLESRFNGGSAIHILGIQYELQL